ncbi:MAG TPA: isoprenylcysteine carboxylmethyltransferase family protein [Rhizomicrobium sp.]|nr:isoprenylcysteine carboxylmethyltransferase family protein [Rhizomicrobium sp.]
MRELAYIIIALVVVQRLAELVYAERNTKNLLARGAIEVGRAHYPLIVLLHAAWLIAIVVQLPPDPPINFILLGIFIVLQALRVWVLATLGPYWTTRIINLPGAPLVRRGPYRLLRHPNYTVVCGEIAVLPLVFGEIWVAVVFTILNALVLAWRIRQENQALAPRRAIVPPTDAGIPAAKG